MKQPLAGFAGIALALVAGVLMPFGVFSASASDFPTFGRWEVLAYAGVAAVAIAAGVWAVLGLVRRLAPRFFPWAVAFVFALAVMLYLQGNLIGLDYGLLDGHAIDWSGMRTAGCVNSGIWLAVLVPGTVGFAALVRRHRDAAVLTQFVFGCYLLILIGCCFAFSPSEQNRPVRFADDNLMELSSDRNLVVFVLDSFDRGLFDLALERRPEVRRELAGLTYYHNTMGRFSATVLALPQLVSGHVPDPEDADGADYRDACYGDAPFLAAAKARGFEVDCYADPTVAPRAGDARRLGCFGNADAEDVALWSAKNFGAFRSLMRVAWFRYLPHACKAGYWDYLMRRGFGCGNADGEETDVRTERRLGELLDADAPFDIVAKRKVKVYHLRSVHEPNFSVERACASLKLVRRYREAVAKAGLAERTALVVLGDHGVLNRRHPIFLGGNGGEAFREDARPVSYRRMGEIWASGLTDGALSVASAAPSEMRPSSHDRTVFRKDFIDDETTVFRGRALELIRLSSSLDTVGDREDERIVWDGEVGFLALPIAPSLRGRPLKADFAFTSSADAAAWSSRVSVRLVGAEAPVRGELKGSVWTLTIPPSAIDASGAFVRILLAPWSAATPPPPIVSIALSSLFLPREIEPN